jgi:hypothetical protein
MASLLQQKVVEKLDAEGLAHLRALIRSVHEGAAESLRQEVATLAANLLAHAPHVSESRGRTFRQAARILRMEAEPAAGCAFCEVPADSRDLFILSEAIGLGHHAAAASHLYPYREAAALLSLAARLMTAASLVMQSLGRRLAPYDSRTPGDRIDP